MVTTRFEAMTDEVAKERLERMGLQFAQSFADAASLRINIFDPADRNKLDLFNDTLLDLALVSDAQGLLNPDNRNPRELKWVPEAARNMRRLGRIMHKSGGRDRANLFQPGNEALQYETYRDMQKQRGAQIDSLDPMSPRPHLVAIGGLDLIARQVRSSGPSNTSLADYL